MSDEDIIWTCFRYFSYYLPPYLFTAKVADVKNACIRNAESFCIKSAYAINTCIKDTYTVNTSSALSTCIKSASHNNTVMEGASKKNTYAKSVCAIKHSK